MVQVEATEAAISVKLCMLNALYELCSNPVCGSLFLQPVVEQHPEIAEVYAQVIKRPLDLTTICARVKCNVYTTEPAKCARRVRRVFKNCEKFNFDSPQYREAARHLQRYFNELWRFYVEWPLRPTSSSRVGNEDFRREKEAWRQHWYNVGRSVALSASEEKRTMDLLAQNEFPEARSLLLTEQPTTLEQLFEAVVNSPAARKKLPARLDTLFCLLSLRCSERRTRGTELSVAWAASTTLKYTRLSSVWWPVLVLGQRDEREDLIVLTANLERLGATPVKGDGDTLVEFLGTHDFSWVKSNTLLFDQGSKAPKRKQDRELYELALNEAQRSERAREDDLEADTVATEVAFGRKSRDDDDDSSTDDDALVPGVLASPPTPLASPLMHDDDAKAPEDDSRIPLKKRSRFKRAKSSISPMMKAAIIDAGQQQSVPIPKIVVRPHKRKAGTEDMAMTKNLPPPPKKQSVSQRPREPTTKATKRERERAARAAKRELVASPITLDRRAVSAKKVAAFLSSTLDGRPVAIRVHKDEPCFVVRKSDYETSKRKKPLKGLSPAPASQHYPKDRCSLYNKKTDEEDEELEGPTLTQPELDCCWRVTQRNIDRELAQAAFKCALDDETDSECESSNTLDLRSTEQTQRISALVAIKTRLEADVAHLEEMQKRQDRTNAARACAVATVNQMHCNHKQDDRSYMDTNQSYHCYADPFLRFKLELKAHLTTPTWRNGAVCDPTHLSPVGIEHQYATTNGLSNHS